MKFLYLSEKVLEKFDERSNGLLLSYITENNENDELKLMYGFETRPDGKEFIKPILVVRDKYFLPIRIFEKDGIEYYKILSVLYDTQYFSSINLNFGLHTELKPIKFNLISIDDVFFEGKYNKDINKNFEDFEWILEETDEEENKVINISIKKRTNKVLKEKKLPLKIKTFRGKVLKLI